MRSVFFFFFYSSIYEHYRLLTYFILPVSDFFFFLSLETKRVENIKFTGVLYHKNNIHVKNIVFEDKVLKTPKLDVVCILLHARSVIYKINTITVDNITHKMHRNKRIKFILNICSVKCKM